MIMMEVEQNNQSKAPFQEESNTEQFFVGGGRGAVLNDIQAALNNQVELITLIGEEGSGKTMLCKMLEEQWDTTHKIIFLPQIVESFEDIVRVVAQECDLQYPADADRAVAKKFFLDLVASLQGEGVNLLLLCDEAENMYLATLERIRKILDEVNAQGGGLQVLLAGRKSLGVNLEQLALCDFNQITEQHFFLSTLDDTETWNYLNFCVQTYRGTEEQEVFTKEAAAKIASMSRGNLRMINMYADESLQSSSADTSFLVLLDHVKDGGEPDGSIASDSSAVSQSLFSQKYIMGGGLFLALVLLIFLFSGDDDGEKLVELKVEQDTNPVFTNPPEQSVEVVEEIKETQIEERVVESVVVEALPPEPVDEVVVVQETQELEQAEIILAPVVNAQPLVEDQTPEEFSPVEEVEKNAIKTDIPELKKQSKISADKKKRIVVNPIISTNQEKMHTVEPVSPSVEKRSVSSASKDPLLGSFVAAGEKWLAGEMDSSFSIQLMSLKSEQAEENLRRIVSQAEYQAVSDKLVMLTRPSDPPVILVFYGVYPTMAAARNARNNMPIFLRDRHPYPVSVRGAVEKARIE